MFIGGSVGLYIYIYIHVNPGIFASVADSLLCCWWSSGGLFLFFFGGFQSRYLTNLRGACLDVTQFFLQRGLGIGCLDVHPRSNCYP